MKYDVTIIGSGLGGLQCAYILSREGFNVCLIEKNRILGGCLQTFKRCGIVFDTGMHYIGGLDEGQVLHNFFKYFDLIRRLKLKRLDENGYDIVRYQDKDYKFAMGYDRFMDSMLQDFPNERAALTEYVNKLKEINNSVDIYNMRNLTGTNTSYLKFFSMGHDTYLDSITSNHTLKNVLLGLSPLYAGIREKTPLYIPMMIHSSYIDGAYRFVDGGSQLSDFLAASIMEYGGTILRNAEVTALIREEHKITALEINHEYRIESDQVISGIHPKSLMQLVDEEAFKPAYRHRIMATEETCGMFSLFLAMKDNSFKYINNNYYSYQIRDIWEGTRYTNESWPGGYMIHFSPQSVSPEYTRSININTYMTWNEVKRWTHTRVENRGDDYRAFKQEKAEKLLALLEIDFPGINKAVKFWYTSTPLTYRDYTGTWEGSVYGMLKDFNNPMKTMLLPRTRISNLLLTGQNMNIHGVVGVTIGSFLTCAELLGSNYLIEKFRNAG